MDALPTEIQYLQALGPTAIAASVAYVAYRQWQTAATKLKLELFDRRLKIYLAVRRLIDVASLYGEVTVEEYSKFIHCLEGAEFVFDDPLRSDIKVVSDKAFRAQLARSRSKRDPDHPSYEKLIKEEDEVLEYLRAQGQKLEDLFRPALDVSKI